MIGEPIAQMRTAVENRDRAAFIQAHDSLTMACNDCHVAMNFGFHVVKCPTSNPYTKQDFKTPDA